jgi:hypothetical protein
MHQAGVSAQTARSASIDLRMVEKSVLLVTAAASDAHERSRSRKSISAINHDL